MAVESPNQSVYDAGTPSFSNRKRKAGGPATSSYAYQNESDETPKKIRTSKPMPVASAPGEKRLRR